MLTPECSISIFADIDCKTFLKQIHLKDYSEDGTFETEENLRPGMYYIRVWNRPEEHYCIDEVVAQKINDAERNVWELNFEARRPDSAAMPSSTGIPNIISVNDDIITSDYENRVVSLKYKRDIDLELSSSFTESANIYLIAEYSELNNKYTYTEDFKDLGLPESFSTDKMTEIFASLWKYGEPDISWKRKDIGLVEYLNDVINRKNVQAVVENWKSDQEIKLKANGVYFVTYKAEDEMYEYEIVPYIYIPHGIFEEGIHTETIAGIYPYSKRKMSKVEIITNKLSINENSIKAPIVYGIEAKEAGTGEILYSNIVCTAINSEEQESILIDDIPLNSVVTVKLLELPFEYTLQDQEEKTITTSSNNVTSVSFTIGKNSETIHYYATANANLKYKGYNNWDNGQVNTFSTNNITINQSFSSGKLNIQAKSTTNEKMFIRAKIVVPSQINCSVEGESDKWNLDLDGYYYYSGLVGANELVESISVDFNNNNLKEKQEFNAVVIIEAILPSYDENGQPYAEWTNSTGSNGEFE